MIKIIGIIIFGLPIMIIGSIVACVYAFYGIIISIIEIVKKHNETRTRTMANSPTTK